MNENEIYLPFIEIEKKEESDCSICYNSLNIGEIWECPFCKQICHKFPPLYTNNISVLWRFFFSLYKSIIV